MEQLKDLIEEINKLQARASAQVSAKNSGTVQTLLGRKRSAQLRLPELKREYRNEIKNRVLPIVVIGSMAAEFVDTAAEKIGAMSVDGEALYKELVKRMPSQAVTGQMSTKIVVDVLGRHFEDIAMESDVVSYPAITHNNKKSFAIKSRSDLEKLIKKLINSNIGPEFTLIYNLNTISDKALEMNFTSKILPVLVTVSDADIVDQILSSYRKFSGTAFLLTAGEVEGSLSEKALASVDSVTEDSVSSALKKVKNTLKKSKGE